MARTATVMTFWHLVSQVAWEGTENEKINKTTPYKQTSKPNALELGVKVGLGAEA